MDIRNIGVVGAGTMGIGVSHAFAEAGFTVALVDIDERALERAKTEIERNVRFYPLLRKEAPARPASDVLQNISFSTGLAALGNAQFVVENATENWGVKQGIFPGLDEVCPEECVLAVNTSAIPITKVAALTGRPDRVIGTHFMNPAPLKPLVEVIRGYHTSADTVRLTQDILAGIGKESIVVEDSPGFVTNRVLMLTINEAIFLLHEGVSSVRDIDRLFKKCFGHTMGPLETADLIGLDTILYSLEVLLENFDDPKYRPCVLLKQLVDAGLHGRKNGKGFYTYDERGQIREEADRG
ncbi:3-hydroxyacyl-CoA dehydrogenase family protein [Kitasatospora sp. GAS204B]|uniref:3-hydroxyacyl-CoA dehydrogenase family protein n=1 Tax=unclassified Kitasatospora TaxID=2633591 RepID=UPI002476D37E|nr:3-hydroxyacyl-CoA dehydrogenase NAD-binding domain-containing protein [Kitasatospora sp. GAS204B]MDH6118958.1 3-hydroxybutyryl-CoA dehydrogenase [Kitasatospora sp. GAS204B]